MFYNIMTRLLFPLQKKHLYKMTLTCHCVDSRPELCHTLCLAPCVLWMVMSADPFFTNSLCSLDASNAHLCFCMKTSSSSAPPLSKPSHLSQSQIASELASACHFPADLFNPDFSPFCSPSCISSQIKSRDRGSRVCAI